VAVAIIGSQLSGRWSHGLGGHFDSWASGPYELLLEMGITMQGDFYTLFLYTSAYLLIHAGGDAKYDGEAQFTAPRKLDL
jgi:hypothetical protein